MKDLFFEVLIAPGFDEDALPVLQSKKNRILLKLKQFPNRNNNQKLLLNGLLIQDIDKGNFAEWNEAGGRNASTQRKRRFDICQSCL